MTPYRPPQQSLRGQLVDAVVILALLFGTLFVTTYVAASQGGGGAADDSEPRALSELPITEAERQQFRTLIDDETMDLAGVNAAVAANQASDDRYDFSVLALVVTVVVIVAYLVFVYRVSFKEYKEVIEEKFGPSGGRGV